MNVPDAMRALPTRATSVDVQADRSHLLSVLTFELVALVVTQKVAIPLGGGEAQVSLALVLHYAVLAYLAARGMVLVSKVRLAILCLFGCVTAFNQIRFSADETSLSSLLLMMVTSAILVFVVSLRWETYRALLHRFVIVALAASLLVGLDWLAQLAGRAMPDLEAVIPRPFVYQAYNYIQPVSWQSPWMKPNALFFLETSHVSQFIAIGLVIEIAIFRKAWRIAALLVGLAGTLGATGMVLFALTTPFLLAKLRPRLVIALAVVVPVALVVAVQSGSLDSMLKRTAEFSQGSSSGFNRFVLPLQWSLATLSAPSDEAWLGRGAGSMPKAVNDEEEGTAGYAWPPYTKVGVEYGTLALVVWGLFVAVSLFGGGVPVAVAWAAFVQYNFLNGSLNVPIHTIYCALLCAGYLIVDRERIVRGASRPPVERRRARHATSRPSVIG